MRENYIFYYRNNRFYRSKIDSNTIGIESFYYKLLTSEVRNQLFLE